MSVVVCTYNQTTEKTFFTLKSIITQKDVSIQLIIADDGSAENNFKRIEEFLVECGFMDFVFVGSGVNRGTVANFMQGVEEASGYYIKPLSPGDAFIDELTLCKWVSELKKVGRKWSFSDVICYYTTESGMIETERKAHPLYVHPYLRKNDRVCRWNYVVLNDIVLGAAVLGEKGVILEYLYRIERKVKYAEDNIWRLMMFDGIVPCYFSWDTLYYEVGSGISTSDDKIWAVRLKKDWDAATREMLSNSDDFDLFQRKMRHGIEIQEQAGKFRKLFIAGKIKMFLIRRAIPRKTRLLENRR